MPVERPFRVRHYECDAYGHLNNTTYLHYVEEVEIDAGGRRPRHLDIRYLTPVSFGDTVVVTAMETEGGRVYDFTRDADRVATAVARWDDTAMSPPPPEPAAVFRRRRTIEWRDVDASNTVGPAVLAELAEDTGLALCAAYRWSLARCTEAGFAMVVRRHEIDYPQAIRLGDDLTIETWASDRGRASAIRHYLMHRDGPVAARFRSHYVWVDAATMRPVRIPERFLADFADNFAGGDATSAPHS